MAKEFKEIKSSSVDPPGKYSTFHKKIEEVAQIMRNKSKWINH